MSTMKTLGALFIAGSVAFPLALAMIGCSGDDNVVPTGDSGTHADVTQGDTGPGIDSGPGVDSGTDSAPGDSGNDADAALPTGMIDKMGRPAISTALNFGDDPKKDAFNHEASFQNWAANTTYDTNFNNNLKTFDALGGDAVDFALTAGIHPLRDALKADYLFLDTGKACTAANSYCETGYLEIEAELLLGGATHTTCGGRTLPEDVMDKTLTLLVTKNRAMIKDNVNAATKAPTRTFPYLADPN